MSDETNQAERKLAALNQSMPFSDEAEKGLLSCLLQDPTERVLECQRDLLPEAFYHVQNRTVYELLLDMQAKNEPIEPASVTHRLKDLGKLDEVGGPAALMELFAFVPVSSHFPFYKKTITEKWLMRQLVNVCADGMEEAFGHGSVAELEDASQVVARAEERIFKVLEAASANKGGPETQVLNSVTMTHEWLDAFQRICDNRGKVLGVQTGWADVDRTFHGLAPDGDGDLLMIGAFPGMGKTVGAVSLIEHMAVECKIPTLVFPLEMGRMGMGHRLYLGRSGVNVNVSRNGMMKKDDHGAVARAAQEVSLAPIFWDHKSSITTAELRAKVQLHVRRHGVKVVVIDHFGQLKPSSDHGRKDERIGQKEIMECLHEIRRNLGVLVVLFVQLDKKAREKQDRNRPPTPGDIRGASEMVEYPTHIAFIHRPPEVRDWAAMDEKDQTRWEDLTHGFRQDCPERWHDGRGLPAHISVAQADYNEHARFIIAKNRWGATTDDICLRFKPALQRFEGRTTHLYSNNEKNRQVILPGF